MMNIEDEHGQGHAEGFQIGVALTFLRALSRDRENHHKSIIQQGWWTSKSDVALRILGMASKVG